MIAPCVGQVELRLRNLRLTRAYAGSETHFAERQLPSFIVVPAMPVCRSEIEACRYWASRPDATLEDFEQRQLMNPGFHPIYHLALLVGLLECREVGDPLVQSFMAIRSQGEILRKVFGNRFNDQIKVLLESPDLQSYLTNVLEQEMQQFRE